MSKTRETMEITITFTVLDWAQRELETRRGYEEPPSWQDMRDEIIDAVEGRFGGGMIKRPSTDKKEEGTPIDTK